MPFVTLDFSGPFGPLFTEANANANARGGRRCEGGRAAPFAPPFPFGPGPFGFQHPHPPFPPFGGFPDGPCGNGRFGRHHPGGRRCGPGSRLFHFHDKEKDDKYVITGVVPGVAMDDITIELNNKRLEISGKYDFKFGSDSSSDEESEKPADGNGAQDPEKAAEADAETKSKQASVEEGADEFIEVDGAEKTPESSPEAQQHSTHAETSGDGAFASSSANAACGAGACGTDAACHGGRRSRHCHRSGTFSHTFTFDAAVDAENITADLTNGILTVTVPKADVPPARRIPIRSAAAKPSA